MNAIPHTPLIAALFGMDERFQKNLTFYLKGPCKGIAVVGNAPIADVDIIDGDNSAAQQLLEERLSATEHRPILVLTLKPQAATGRVRFIAKPVQVDSMVSELLSIGQQLSAAQPSAVSNAKSSASSDQNPEADADATRKRFDPNERLKLTKHNPAPVLNEKSFMAFVGAMNHLDASDNPELIEPVNVTRHFLACVKTAYRSATEQNEIVRLNSAWKPLILLPNSHEVWLDADDNQLRAFASLSLNKMAGRTITLTPLEDSQTQQLALDKYQDMDTFLWKLAIWTSKGRYVSAIEIDKPVFLKRWPNFTRLVVTPYAMRITALLINGQHLPTEIGPKLDIPAQYVFVFLSACCSIGILGQDHHYLPPGKSAKQHTGKQSLFNKILSKLRGS